MDDHVYVDLHPVDGYPPYEVEEIDASRIEGDTFAITGVPVFARDLAVEDVVETAVANGRRVIARVISEGGHSTIRVVFFSNSPVHSEDRESRLHRAVSDAGAGMGSSPIPGLYAIDAPPATDFIDLLGALRLGQREGWWDIELATVAPRHRSVENDPPG